jgi:hypothetical protein
VAECCKQKTRELTIKGYAPTSVLSDGYQTRVVYEISKKTEADAKKLRQQDDYSYNIKGVRNFLMPRYVSDDVKE